MALVNMRDMLHHALRNGYAVGAFQPVDLVSLQLLVATAERLRSPLVLSVAQSRAASLDPQLMLPAFEAAARRAAVPVAIELDGADARASAERAINLGCGSIALDAGYFEALDRAGELVSMAHACGVPVEGGPGPFTGLDSDAAQARARAYLEHTGVDFLRLIAAGSEARGVVPQAICRALEIPGAVGAVRHLGDEQIRALIGDGVAKLGFPVVLETAAMHCLPQVRDAGVAENTHAAYAARLEQALAGELERCLRTCCSIGKADSVLEACEPWTPVEHLIIYNVTGISDAQARAMIAQGERVLSEIPGVRQVVTGEAVREDAQYRYTWLVRFCHPAVIDSYREHPAHVAFADQLFRPVAGERISIDYRTL